MINRICLAAAPEGDDSVYESILRIFRETDLHEEKERCMRALGASRDPKLLVCILSLLSLICTHTIFTLCISDN